MNTLANNMRLLNFVAKDKKAFVLFKVESHQDEINNNDLAMKDILEKQLMTSLKFNQQFYVIS